MKNTKALLIFVKNPKRGLVKTRLAKTLGHDKALDIYKTLLECIRNTSQELEEIDLYVCYDRFIDNNDDWSPATYSKTVQAGDDLGERMFLSLETALNKYDKAILIGSDCPSINTNILEDAFAKLEQHPIVLGPAKDGGYYLVGMTVAKRFVFENIEWSTPTVFENTVKAIEAHNYTFGTVALLSDIDTEEDWNAWLKSVKT